MKTPYELFLDEFHAEPDKFKDKLRGSGTFDYKHMVDDLCRLNNQLSGRLLVHLFGENMGNHLAHKFVVDKDRNLMSFFAYLEDNYLIFLLHQLKTNETLFANC